MPSLIERRVLRAERRRGPSGPVGIASPTPPVNARAFLASTALFDGLDEAALDEVVRGTQWLALPGGETLFEQGDPGDSLYLVVSGRLRVFRQQAGGTEQVVRDVGRGDNVGEMAMVTGEPRSATVRAVRDTELVRLSRDAFDCVLERHPRSRVQLTRMLAGWLSRSHAASAHPSGLSTIAILPAAPDAPLGEFARRLLEALNALGPTLHLNAACLDAHLRAGAAQLTEHDLEHGNITRWMSEQEASHRFVLYEADPHRSGWTRRCLRQADRILLVAWGTAEPDAGFVQDLLATREVFRPRTEQDLVLLHRDGHPPLGTARWLAASNFSTHHHLRLALPADFERLARHLTGRSIGLVLGSGGARGFAHIGVIRALREAGVPIDRIGGTSMGAVIAAQYASGCDHETMIELNRRGWIEMRPFRQYSLPLISLLSGRRALRIAEALVGQCRIEDLWLSYFCVSTDLSNSTLRVHREGPLARCVLASSSIPGILPPVVGEGAGLLVDGAVLDGLPTDVMRRLGAGPVIAVDVSMRVEMAADRRYREAPSPWQVLLNSVNPFIQSHPFPSIFRILQRSTQVAGAQRAGRAREEVSLYLDPPLGRFDMFDWKSLDRIVEAGYQFARERIPVWLEKQAVAFEPSHGERHLPQQPRGAHAI